MDNKPTYLLRIKEVARRTGMSVPTIYRKMKANEFPKPDYIGPKIAVWEDSIIEDWIQATLQASREARHKAT